MAHDPQARTDRRSFLQAGALATASAMSAAPASGAQQVVARDTVLPRRKLGKTGVELTMLEQGAVRSDDRVLRFAFANGVRVFDTAKVYGTEPSFKKWFEQDRRVRKEIVMVTKDTPKAPRDADDGRSAAEGPRYRLHRSFLRSRFGGRTKPGRLDQLRQEPGVQGDRRRDPEVGQGQVHRLLDPSQGPWPDHPGGRRRGIRRRDHAPVHPLAR